MTPSGVSTSAVSRYLWPGRLIRIWSPITSAANSASGPIHLKLIVPRLFPIPSSHRLGTTNRASVKPARPSALDPGRVLSKEWFQQNRVEKNQCDGFGRGSSSGPQRSGMGDIRWRYRNRAVCGAVAAHMVFRRHHLPDFCRHVAWRRAQCHGRSAWPRRAAAAGAAADHRLPGAGGDVVGRGVPRRHQDRAAGDRTEQHDQVAARERKDVPRGARRRYQLFRSRLVRRCASRLAGDPGTRRGNAAQPAQRQCDRIKRWRHPGSDVQGAAGHRERGRQFLHRAVPRTGFCGAARGLS